MTRNWMSVPSPHRNHGSRDEQIAIQACYSNCGWVRLHVVHLLDGELSQRRRLRIGVHFLVERIPKAVKGADPATWRR